MKLEEIKALAELMKANELTGLELTEGECTLKLERKSALPNPLPISVANDTVKVQTTATPAGPVTAVAKPEEEGVPVESPMVGVFYAAPDPGAEPFVALGKKVKKGDVLCIIEAMKLMNEIVAERDGTINKIGCTNGQTVEFGQELFRMIPEEA